MRRVVPFLGLCGRWLGYLGLFFGVAGCEEEQEAPVEVGEPVETLPLPDVSGVDFAAAFKEQLQLAKGVHAGRVWAGMVASLERAQRGCPDFYLGAEGGDGMAEGDAVWRDSCTTGGGTTWSGGLGWRSALTLAGVPEEPEGQTLDATREIAGNGAVEAGGETVYLFDGEASDATASTVAPGYARWTWSSTIRGTLAGSAAFEPGSAAAARAPGGGRPDLALSATGGDSAVLELRGSVYLPDGLLLDRFDSLEVDAAFLGPGAAGPEDCALEPRGWLGLRDQNAYWYDLVFLPRYDDEAGDTGATGTRSVCDGCGTLYLRGVEAVDLGQICMDFGFLFTEEALSPPVTADYVLSLHEILSDLP